MRYLLCLCALALLLPVLGQEEPAKKKVTAIITAADDANMVAQVEGLLTDNTERLEGKWPFTPPPGDPSKITTADYFALLDKYLPGYVKQYSADPIQPNGYAYEALPVFAAYWRATKEPKYADLALRAVKAFCLGTDADVAEQNRTMSQTGATRPEIDRYWTWCYAYVLVPVMAMDGCPRQAEMLALLGKSLGDRANGWPIYWERGAHNRPMDAAFWYNFALKYHPNLSRAKELAEYADFIWSEWWPHRDMEEDDSGYAAGDCVTLDAWCRVRGVEWWKEQDGQNLWRHYAEQVAPDGTWPAYGDGCMPGNYTSALLIAELTAARTRDGRYKWLAHRAFWNLRPRIDKLMEGIGGMNVTAVAMACLYADDSIKEVAPSAGLLLTKRRFRERTDWSHRQEMDLFFLLRDEWAPSKLIFHSGPKENDLYLLVQAGNSAGHGHPDCGNIMHMSGDQAYYLSNGVGRLEHTMEEHNLFTLQQPGKKTPWPHNFTSEASSVPVQGSAKAASYARLHIQEFPGTTTTPERWQTVLTWNKNYTEQRAIGYKNWPVRLDRCILFVNNKFAVVRDVANFLLPVEARMGPNWVLGEIGPSIGTNWVNAWAPRIIYGHFWARRAPVETAPRDLLVWFVPRADGEMELTDRAAVLGWGGAHINLPMRAYYAATGDWTPGQPQAFTTVLLPHPPVADPGTLAANISAVADSPAYTAITVKDGATTYLLLLNTSGTAVTAGALTTDAEAALLTSVNGKPVAVAAWQATVVKVGKTVAHQSKTAAKVVEQAL